VALGARTALVGEIATLLGGGGAPLPEVIVHWLAALIDSSNIEISRKYFMVPSE
jgi:hypothetical protein